MAIIYFTLSLEVQACVATFRISNPLWIQMKVTKVIVTLLPISLENEIFTKVELFAMYAHILKTVNLQQKISNMWFHVFLCQYQNFLLQCEKNFDQVVFKDGSKSEKEESSPDEFFDLIFFANFFGFLPAVCFEF